MLGNLRDLGLGQAVGVVAPLARPADALFDDSHTRPGHGNQLAVQAAGGHQPLEVVGLHRALTQRGGDRAADGRLPRAAQPEQQLQHGQGQGDDPRLAGLLGRLMIREDDDALIKVDVRPLDAAALAGPTAGQLQEHEQLPKPRGEWRSSV
jgi:hypothetical protein